MRPGSTALRYVWGQPEHREHHLHRLLRGHAEALEADVDLDEHLARAGRGLRVRPRGVEIHQGRDEAVGKRLARCVGQRVGIDQDRRGDPARAQPDALGHVGHAQAVGAVADEHRPHLGGAVPVAIRLHDREDLP